MRKALRSVCCANIRVQITKTMKNTFISGDREENFQICTLKCSAVQRTSFIYWYIYIFFAAPQWSSQCKIKTCDIFVNVRGVVGSFVSLPFCSLPTRQKICSWELAPCVSFSAKHIAVSCFGRQEYTGRGSHNFSPTSCRQRGMCLIAGNSQRCLLGLAHCNPSISPWGPLVENAMKLFPTHV